jgi:hypothetical protein
LSRGSGPASYPAKPLVSYQINRQLSGWNLPPLMVRAFGAHGQQRTLCRAAKFVLLDHLVGGHKKARWHSKAECLRGLEVERRLILGRCLHRKVDWFGVP